MSVGLGDWRGQRLTGLIEMAWGMTGRETPAGGNLFPPGEVGGSEGEQFLDLGHEGLAGL